MFYAKVVLGIPVAGPFDYIVPSGLVKKIKAGSRVRVNFGHKDTVAYVVGLAKASGIAKLKPILEVLDDFPALDRQMLLLTKQVSEYYFCSWGQAIETALPQALRKSKGVSGEQEMPEVGTIAPPVITLLHSLDEEGKWDIYIKDIKEALACGGSVIILVPDLSSALRAREAIAKNTDITPVLIYRQQPKELEWWLKARRGESKIIVGTRSAVFVPLPGLKLLIIDEEQNSAYKQDQVPHYHAREVAFMRSDRQGVKLVLGSSSPSLESLRLAKENKIKYIFLPRKKAFPEIKIINTFSEYNMLTQRKLLLTKYLQDAVVSALSLKEKVLLFINRKGFATQGRCQGCGV
ncbi:MAG: hypothetical protein PHG40_03170, partial [Candidatus Omnitrophica bacterium]|nr:hypothetical protein [Candidatus Omnitrophota bacterium]